MKLLESGEMYLETIYVLSRTGRPVRSVDVGEYRGFSKPSVSRAVRLLKEGGYLTVNREGYLTLTEVGSEIARKIYRRHTLIGRLLTRLGVEEATAVEDACRIEHVISDESFAAIERFMAERFPEDAGD